MNRFARLGFVLLGVHGLLGALQSLSYSIAAASSSDTDDPERALFAIGFSALALGFVPPALVIWFNERLAELVFPSNADSQSEPNATAFLAAGVSVVGVYAALMGLAKLFGVVLSASVSLRFLENPSFRGPLLSNLCESALTVIFGGTLFY
jgi:hypothetical protein